MCGRVVDKSTRFVKLSSPNVRRSAVSGKLVYVSDRQLAKERERAKQQGLFVFEEGSGK